jgi:hypothetical protein
MKIRPNKFYDREILIRINWAEKYVDNIYECGITDVENGGGCCAFFEIKDAKFNYICCSHTDSHECLAIKYAKELKEQSNGS